MENYRYARFVEADFSGAEFRGVDFTEVTISDAWLQNVQLSGRVDGLSVNGIDVTEYVERQLDERHPERTILAPTDSDGMRVAWRAIELFSAATLERARRLPPDRLAVSVGGEWTFLETIRHLVFATDRWIGGPVFGDADPFHRLGMPNPPRDEAAPGIFELDTSPSPDEVFTLRRSRMDRVAEFLITVENAELDRAVQSPNGGATSVRNCLHVVFREEWWHNQYANRDLEVLEGQ